MNARGCYKVFEDETLIHMFRARVSDLGSTLTVYTGRYNNIIHASVHCMLHEFIKKQLNHVPWSDNELKSCTPSIGSA